MFILLILLTISSWQSLLIVKRKLIVVTSWTCRIKTNYTIHLQFYWTSSTPYWADTSCLPELLILICSEDFSFTLKYSGELSINSESKNGRDKSYLSSRCFSVGFCSCTAILYLVSAVNLVPRSLVYEAEGEIWCDRLLGMWQAVKECMLEINPEF